MMRSALSDRQIFRLHLDRRELLLGTTALIAWASIPTKAEILPRSSIASSGSTAPMIALDPASDLGASNSDNISNDPLPSLLITVNSSISEGTIVDIFDNGVSYATHKLTAAELSSGIVLGAASSLKDGLHNINAVIVTDGKISSLSNTLVYQLDTSISKPALSGKSLTTETTPIETIAFGTTKPRTGDILVLVDADNGSVLGEKTLGADDLIATTIRTPALSFGVRHFSCYVYGSDNRFSPMSAAFAQTIEPTKYITTTANGRAGSSPAAIATNLTQGTSIQFDSAHNNQLSIGNGVVVFGVTAGTNSSAMHFISMTVHSPNRTADPVGTALTPIVTGLSSWFGNQYALFFSYNNIGTGYTTCDIDFVFTGAGSQATSVMTWTMSGTTNTSAYATAHSYTTNYHQNISLRLAAPNGGAVFALASAFRSDPPIWRGDLVQNVLYKDLSTGDSFNSSSVHENIPGARILTITEPNTYNAAGNAVAAVSFGP